MNIAKAEEILQSKGFYLSSVSRMSPDMGYLASSRSIKNPRKPELGEGGFGKTPSLAVAALLRTHGFKQPTGDPMTELEAALDALIEVLG